MSNHRSICMKPFQVTLENASDIKIPCVEEDTIGNNSLYRDPDFKSMIESDCT